MNWSWSQCIKSRYAQTSSGKGLPSHFWNRNIVRSILPGLRRKITGLLLRGTKSSFQMKIHFAFYLEIKVPESGGRVEDTESTLLEVQCEVSTVSDDLGCHVICWCWSTVFSEVHSQPSHLPGHFRALHASFCWQALWRCVSFSSRTWHLHTLSNVLKAGSMTMVLLCLIGLQTRLTWTP